MELNIVENDNTYFQDNMSCYPEEYVKWVTKQLNCDKSDLRLLDVHPDFKEQDEEGWNIKSFFPINTKIGLTCVHSDGEIETLQFDKFSIGEVLKLEVNGKILIVDYNSSPCSVWINKADIW